MTQLCERGILPRLKENLSFGLAEAGVESPVEQEAGRFAGRFPCSNRVRVMIDFIDATVRPEGPLPTGGDGSRMQIRCDDAGSFPGDSGHFGDGLLRRRDVSQRK